MGKVSIPPELSGLFSDERKDDIKQKIVEELLNPEKNLDTKTELDHPIKWAVLEVIKQLVEDKDMKISAKVIIKFIKSSLTYLISHNREGRKEYVQALNALTQFEEKHKDLNVLNTNTID